MAKPEAIEVQWSSLAIDDALEIVDFIAADRPKAAEAMIELIEETIGQLSHMPERGRIGRVSGTRELVLTPNYIAVYQYDNGQVTVLRVLHAMQQWPKV